MLSRNEIALRAAVALLAAAEVPMALTLDADELGPLRAASVVGGVLAIAALLGSVGMARPRRARDAAARALFIARENLHAATAVVAGAGSAGVVALAQGAVPLGSGCLVLAAGLLAVACARFSAAQRAHASGAMRAE
ncbi:hypothetical protein QT381_12485 [Galbitalea sp. SE-J8]|uniref:hypothetical protein n=1 Tax=Galbitalea sp. SE-J8 TaxID=3054952 RepID=UPI00259CA1A0|nr:hypothetical protein [Galbitalea sp. SE-J8]MDM4763825.1 hypothetical protein [Galbitalea sp. SE-J8]